MYRISSGKGEVEVTERSKNDIDEGISNNPFEQRPNDLQQAAEKVECTNRRCAAASGTAPSHQGRAEGCGRNEKAE